MNFEALNNFKSFFNHGNPDWWWIRKKVKALAPEHK